MYTISGAVSILLDSGFQTNFSHIGDERPCCIKIDSRHVKRGDIFLAMRGKRYDGHSFCQEALDRGASFVVVSETQFLAKNTPHIRVQNTEKTLRKLAKAFRKRFQGIVVGVTGSNGKTTTKDLLIHVLSGKYSVGGTIKNQNNHIGVCLTLLNLKKDYDLFIVEMGISQRGEMDLLADIVVPDGAIMTNIHPAHLKGFGSVDVVMEEKLKILNHMTDNSFFLLHHDDLSLLEKSQFFRGNRLNILNVLKKDLLYFQESCAHLVSTFKKNALLVFRMALYLGMNAKEIVPRIKTFSQTTGRFHVTNSRDMLWIDDTYNANPVSFLEGLKDFQCLSEERRKILCLGDMEDLGSQTLFWHERVLSKAVSLGPFRIILIGSFFKKVYEHNPSLFPIQYVFLCANVLEAIELWNIPFKKGDALYAKGSRKYELERLIVYLQTHHCEMTSC